MTEPESEELAKQFAALAAIAKIKPMVNSNERVPAMTESKPSVVEVRRAKDRAQHTSRSVPDGRRRRSKLIAPLNARISEEAKAMLVELSIEDGITMGQWLDNAIRAYAESRKSKG